MGRVIPFQHEEWFVMRMLQENIKHMKAHDYKPSIIDKETRMYKDFLSEYVQAAHN